MIATLDARQFKIRNNNTGKTLTLRAYHANNDGTYPAKIAKLTSISIDPFFSEIRKAKIKKDKSTKGKFDTSDYVERGIRNQRMTSDMISLDAKKPDKFFFSKTGRLQNLIKMS